MPVCGGLCVDARVVGVCVCGRVWARVCGCVGVGGCLGACVTVRVSFRCVRVLPRVCASVGACMGACLWVRVCLCCHVRVGGCVGSHVSAFVGECVWMRGCECI